MVNADLLAKFKPGSILVNTARGDLLDNLAVRQALLDGPLSMIAMDTLAPEPTPGDHPLVDLPEHARHRAVYSAHLGGSSGGSFARAHLTMWENARRILNGERPTNVVNGI
jgi:phosphoglycerate dehydrogenase-like enzyme